MNRKVYRMISQIPLVGTLLRPKLNFFAGKNADSMEHLFGTEQAAILKKWVRDHPKQVISPRAVKKLLKKSRKKE